MVFNTFSFEAQKREKIRNYRTGFWNFGLITKLPLAGSSTSVSLHLAYDGAVRRRSHLATPRVAPPPKTAPAPLGLPRTSSPGVPPELDTRPRSSPARHDVAMAEPHAAPGCALPGRAYPSRPLSSSPIPASPPSRSYKKGHRPPCSRVGRPPMPLPPASSAHRGTTPSAPPRLK